MITNYEGSGVQPVP